MEKEQQRKNKVLIFFSLCAAPSGTKATYGYRHEATYFPETQASVWCPFFFLRLTWDQQEKQTQNHSLYRKSILQKLCPHMRTLGLKNAMLVEEFLTHYYPKLEKLHDGHFLGYFDHPAENKIKTYYDT